MKKGLSLFVAIMMLIIFSLTSFADMGYPVAPNIEEFEAYVGLDGVTAENHWDGSDLYVSAGTRIRIFYKSDDGTYMFYGSGSNNEPITGDIAPGNFSTGKQVVAPYETSDQKMAVSVTSDVGINLRCGPSTNYPSFTVIKKGAKLEYTSVFSNEGMDWGYTQYNGQAGWVSLKYTQTVATTTAKPTEKQTKPTTVATQEETQPLTSPLQSSAGATSTRGALGKFLNANNTVVVCIVVAVLLALVAIVLILYIFKLRKRNDNAQFLAETGQSYMLSGYETEQTPEAEKQVNTEGEGLRLCPTCGAALVKGGKFCSACGKPLEKNGEDA